MLILKRRRLETTALLKILNYICFRTGPSSGTLAAATDKRIREEAEEKRIGACNNIYTQFSNAEKTLRIGMHVSKRQNR